MSIDWIKVAKTAAQQAREKLFSSHWGIANIDVDGNVLMDDDGPGTAFAFYDNHPFEGIAVDARGRLHDEIARLYLNAGIHELARATDDEGYTAVIVFEGSSDDVEDLEEEQGELIEKALMSKTLSFN